MEDHVRWEYGPPPPFDKSPIITDDVFSAPYSCMCIVLALAFREPVQLARRKQDINQIEAYVR